MGPWAHGYNQDVLELTGGSAGMHIKNFIGAALPDIIREYNL